MSLKRNLIGNGIANIIQKFVRVLEQLLLVPFFITCWGSAFYGEWLTLTIIPSVLAFSDLGLGSAAANSFVLKYASGDKKNAADISKTGFIIISCAVLLCIILSIIVIFLGVWFGWFTKSLIPVNEAISALVLLIIARLIGFYNELYGANFIAARKANLGINLLTINYLLNIAAGLLVLFFKGNIVQYALWQLIISILFNLFYWRCAVTTLALNKEYKGSYNKIIAKQIFTKGLGYLMSPVWQSILFQGTTFVVRLILGPAAVTVFNTVRTLSRSVNQLYALIGGSVFPEIQFEIGSGNMDRAKKIFIRSIQITFVLSIIGLVILALVGLPMYNIWTKNVLNPPYLMWFLFLLSTLFNAVWWAFGVAFRSMNKPSQLSFPGVIFASISIACTYFCCHLWGLTGAAVGSLFFEILMVVYILPASNKLMGVSLIKYFSLKGE